MDIQPVGGSPHNPFDARFLVYLRCRLVIFLLCTGARRGAQNWGHFVVRLLRSHSRCGPWMVYEGARQARDQTFCDKSWPVVWHPSWGGPSMVRGWVEEARLRCRSTEIRKAADQRVSNDGGEIGIRAHPPTTSQGWPNFRSMPSPSQHWQPLPPPTLVISCSGTAPAMSKSALLAPHLGKSTLITRCHLAEPQTPTGLTSVTIDGRGLGGLIKNRVTFREVTKSGYLRAYLNGKPCQEKHPIQGRWPPTCSTPTYLAFSIRSREMHTRSLTDGGQMGSLPSEYLSKKLTL